MKKEEMESVEEVCAYCKKPLPNCGQLQAFIQLEDRYRSFCLGNCHEKYVKKIQEVEVMQLKEDLWDVLLKLGELKDEDPEKYAKTISVIEDLIKVVEGSAERILKLLERLGMG